MGIGISFGKSKSGSSNSHIGKIQQSTWDKSWTDTAGKTSGETESSYWTPEQKQLAGTLSGYLGGSMQPSAWQQTGQTALTQAATGQGYKDIVDPAAANALYAAIEKQTLEDILPKSTRAIAGEANLAGMLRSGPALQMQLNNRDQIVNELAKTLSGLKYQDETQRRQIEQEREGRMLPAGQSILSADPNQASINNILQMLGIRGTATEQSQTESQQETVQKQIDRIYRTLFEKNKGGTSSSNFGLSGGF